MNVLVTGGAGFIGSHIVDALLARGDSVICVDNFNDYYDPKQKEKNISEHKDNPNYKLYRTDISDLDSLKKVFVDNKMDKIIHLAARAGVRPSIDDPILYEKVNILGTINLLELCKKHDIKVFIFVSSSSIYGNRDDPPFKETDNVDNPISPYAATKKAGELLCYTYHHLYGIKISCLRYFTVYGPRGRPDMAPLKFTKLIDQDQEIPLYGDGSARRDFTYVADIVNGTILALDKEFDYEIFNLGNSNPIKVSYFISVIEDALGKKAKIKQLPVQPGDVPMTCADISKAKKMLGYDPKTPIEDGIKKLVEWYNEEKN